MTFDGEEDDELAAIRARRLRDLLAERAGPARDRPTAPTELTGSSFAAFLAENPRTVIDVWAPWCGPCRTMGPVLDALARELGPDVRFGKINADEHPETVARWNVEGIPTLLVFRRGRLIDRVVGAYPHDALRDHLRTVFGGGAPAGPGGTR